MKTAENETTQESIKTVKIKMNPLKSLRPQKSMVRVKSLKPKRLRIASKVSVKSSVH